MATPVSAPRNYEYVLRRTFWFPMIKIIGWHAFLYFVNIFILFSGKFLNVPLPESRLHFLFHFLVLIGTVWILLRWNSIRYTITNDKIIVEKGILNIDRNTFLFRNIECVKLHKNIMGRICWFGTIEMYAPTLQETVFLYCVSNAKKYFTLIQKSISVKSESSHIVFPSNRRQRALESERAVKIA